MTSETSRTDAMIQPIPGRDCVTNAAISVVHADDCRQLERELAAKEAEIAEVEQALSFWKGLADLARVHGNTTTVGVKLLVKELEQSRAQVARLLVDFEKINNIEQNRIMAGTGTDFAGSIINTICEEVLTPIPEQSARDAAVLRAAEKLVEYMDANGVKSKGTWLGDKTYIIPVLDDLVQAVRGDKT